MRTFYFFILFLSVIVVEIRAQVTVKSEYMTGSSYKNKDGEDFGSGDFLKVSGRYHIPLSVKQNDLGQVTLWAASLNTAYGILGNNGMARDLNPDKILNAGINLTHMRPISDKWSLLATLGGGIYSAHDAITGKSILVNGGVIFMYKIGNNFDLGAGLGLTNSFGLPVVMPMSVINWRLSGKYEVKVDIAGGMAVSGAININDKLKLKLVAMEMDGMSSVMSIDGESMIYASTIMKSFLCPEFKIGKSSTLYIGAGGAWLRSTTLTKRSLKDFFNNLFHDKNRHLGFSSSGYFTVGYKYGF
ncbi:MAG: DUF6268 family outer membrane beta-barrel protein [Bacteroidales bacterium]|jgi:hypothetical protein|nr:DUF6268 family outer membrane beta-barrel protein [Bacteroidales bacterium]